LFFFVFVPGFCHEQIYQKRLDDQTVLWSAIHNGARIVDKCHQMVIFA
jgi:hypothetical protein